MAPGRLPDFLVIGGQRCGTTSFYEGLTSLPSFGRAVTKEVHYFDLQYEQGADWYRAQFPPSAGRSIVGEASPYYIFHPLVPQRVARDLPDVRVIALLREPVARAVSHYHHEVREGRESLPFEEALEREEERLRSERGALRTGADWAASHHRAHAYAARGRWAEQLSRWFSEVPRDRFLVLFSERYYADPAETLRETAFFLGAAPPTDGDLGRACDAVAASARSQPVNPPTPARILERLRASFEEHDEALRRLLGTPLPWDVVAR